MIINLSEETVHTIINALGIADSEAGSSESIGMNFNEVAEVFLDLIDDNFEQLSDQFKKLFYERINGR